MLGLALGYVDTDKYGMGGTVGAVSKDVTVVVGSIVDSRQKAAYPHHYAYYYKRIYLSYHSYIIIIVYFMELQLLYV